MDAGVIVTWKRSYRRQMIREIVRELETRAQWRESNRELLEYMNGISECFDGCDTFVQTAWDDVSHMTISRCWVKADSLHREQKSKVNSACGPMRNSGKNKDVRDMAEMLGKLMLEREKVNDDILCLSGQVTADSVANWMDVAAPAI